MFRLFLVYPIPSKINGRLSAPANSPQIFFFAGGGGYRGNAASVAKFSEAQNEKKFYYDDTEAMYKEQSLAKKCGKMRFVFNYKTDTSYKFFPSTQNRGGESFLLKA